MNADEMPGVCGFSGDFSQKMNTSYGMLFAINITVS